MIDFDHPIDRTDTHAEKYEARLRVFGCKDVIPLWVADMDFPCAEAISQALITRAKHPIYSYSHYPDSMFQAMMDWFMSRHLWSIAREEILMAPGVVPSLHAACLAFAKEGEGIIIQSPVYPPFANCVKKTGRKLLTNALLERDGHYQINFEDLRVKAAQAKVLLLCSPHNPVGRVWTQAELEQLVEIASEHNLFIISDEIHADLVYRKHAFTPLARLGSKHQAYLDKYLLTAVAPSKSFNIAGLSLSALVSKNTALLAQINHQFSQLHSANYNPFSMTGFEAGYRYGADWLDQVLGYLAANKAFVISFVEQHLSPLSINDPEGTYLMWLDCRRLKLTDAALKDFFVNSCAVGLNSGSSFGHEGNGFMRLNIASPRAILAQALGAIKQQLPNLIEAKS